MLAPRVLPGDYV
jgi:hypothetical protein